VQRLVRRLLESFARAALRWQNGTSATRTGSGCAAETMVAGSRVTAEITVKKESGRTRPDSFDGGVSYIFPIARIFRTIGRIFGAMWSGSLTFICGEKFKRSA